MLLYIEENFTMTVQNVVTAEQLFELLRYKLVDPENDVALEVKEYLQSQNHKSNKTASESTNSDLLNFYSSSEEFYIGNLGVHLKHHHMLNRSALLISAAVTYGAKTYADWGAGAGRDCIIMARYGLKVTHFDVLGEGTELARWRYEQRGLSVIIADAMNPPDETYDLISSFDCLEHVEDPVWHLAQLLNHLNPGGILCLAGDFYNFHLTGASSQTAACDGHLPKNFVYGGIMHVALERLGWKKLFGNTTPWLETATAYPTLWQKPTEASKLNVTKTLYKEIYELLLTFRKYYDEEIARAQQALRD